MDRINQIINNTIWQNAMDQIRDYEDTRIFCGHDLSHLMDVARMAYIDCIESGIETDEIVNREMIYATALLHDIGRGRQYADGTDHHIAGAEIAEAVLAECGFNAAEIEAVKDAILGHRSKADSNPDEAALSRLIRKADKASRFCMLCDAASKCNWPEERKNKNIIR